MGTPGALSLGVKRSGRDAYQSPPSSVEVKECVKLYLHSPYTPSWSCDSLKKHRKHFTFTIATRMALGPTQPPIQWVQGALYLVLKQLRCEADHSPPSSAEVKE